MVKKIIKMVPGLYDFCQHIVRRRNIKKINGRKSLSLDEQIKLVEKTYLERIGHQLDWSDLRSYTEKMQWAKMYDNDPMKSLLADKYLVRSWVTEKIGDKYLIPLLGCWDNFDEINFDMLPNQFVLKTNNGSGTNLIVKDKLTLNVERVRRLVNDWLDTDFAYYNPFEFQYESIKPKIIAEKFMATETGELPDYKFLCFNGKPYFCWVDVGRYSEHKRNIYDMEWNLQSWNQLNYGTTDYIIPCPNCFDEMKEIAATLAEGFSHVRVDLYVINKKVYFGEMTFTNGSGFEKIIPNEADLMLGKLWDLKVKISSPE